MSTASGRKRARLACDPCRELKRKCDGDGHRSCGNCARFEYECTYSGSSRSRQKARGGDLRRDDLGPTTPATASYSHGERRRTPDAPPHNETRSLEANSGATFLRKLALRLDPHSAPRLHTFAWNAFLGARKIGHIATSLPLTSLLPLPTMQKLALVYFQKIDPTYGFVDRPTVERQMERRWAGLDAEPMRDAILCGIAALGCLYSHVQPPKMELDLAESARHILEHALSDFPTIDSITAWVLRVVYLRITDTHHTAWTASCILMHMIEAAGLHREPSGDSIIPSTQGIDLELRRRLTAVAQHLNIWTSFDMGRSRVALCNATIAMPSARPGGHTSELMELLPYSAELDPQKSPSVSDLETALLAVINRAHSASPSILGQCNLALCLCRRLQSMNALFTGNILEQMLALCSKGIQAAQDILDDRAPWHQVCVESPIPLFPEAPCNIEHY
ncbi:hypothetical protein F4778DRAFT_690634 [Xylariomycetidae sp. FL2044]|nr:hypothetical protein F4778DRAFT_690634 [Xylariomycetidae sp. FL2044]